MASHSDLSADHYAQHKTIETTSVYLTVLPAELVPGYKKGLPGSEMHNDEHNLKHGQHHIMVNLIDLNTGALLKKATVFARVIGKDFKSSNKKMELMFMDGTKGYGNYFGVPRQGVYKVELEIKYLGIKEPVTVAFQYAST